MSSSSVATQQASSPDLMRRVRLTITATSASETEFAAQADIEPHKLADVLAGQRRLTSLDYAKIAERGQVTVDWLLTGQQTVLDVHEVWCCTVHGTHAVPHRRCCLRPGSADTVSPNFLGRSRSVRFTLRAAGTDAYVTHRPTSELPAGRGLLLDFPAFPAAGRSTALPWTTSLPVDAQWLLTRSWSRRWTPQS